jgi:hypothetical protein
MYSLEYTPRPGVPTQERTKCGKEREEGIAEVTEEVKGTSYPVTVLVSVSNDVS